MPTCALVGATEFNKDHFVSQRFDCIIAVDRGYASLTEAGFVPDLVVGDFDSLGYVPQGENVLCFPSKKDKSDMELSIHGAIEGGYDTLLFYGALGGRLDHTIANVQLMVGCARRGLRVAAIDGDYVLVVLDGAGQDRVEFDAFDPAPLDEGSYGRYISLFSYGGTALDVTETGLKYSLMDAELSDEVSLGLSNEFTGQRVSISLEAGNALLTFSSAAWPYFKW